MSEACSVIFYVLSVSCWTLRACDQAAWLQGVLAAYCGPGPKCIVEPCIMHCNANGGRHWGSDGPNLATGCEAGLEQCGSGSKDSGKGNNWISGQVETPEPRPQTESATVGWQCWDLPSSVVDRQVAARVSLARTSALFVRLDGQTVSHRNGGCVGGRNRKASDSEATSGNDQVTFLVIHRGWVSKIFWGATNHAA